MELTNVALICKALGDSKQIRNSANVVRWRKMWMQDLGKI